MFHVVFHVSWQVSDRDPTRQQPLAAQETSQGKHAATDVVVVDVTLAAGQHRVVATSDAGQGRVVDVDSCTGGDVDARAVSTDVTAQQEEGFQGERTIR